LALRNIVLYLQYTNPAAYPPLENGARMMAENGWNIRFFGIDPPEVSSFRLEEHPNISTKLLRYCRPGWLQKLHYFWYLLEALTRALLWRPKCVYVSDPLATPVGLILAYMGFKVVYHEHDSPDTEKYATVFNKCILISRKYLARKVQVNVLPQTERIKKFNLETKSKRPSLCVWNCPSQIDAIKHFKRLRLRNEPLGVYYHGSINLNRVPLSLIEGASRSKIPVVIRIAGYETVGSKGARRELELAASGESQVSIEFAMPCPQHSDLAANMKGMHVGWINFLDPGEDFNLTYMVGASNKAFDYLAQSMPIIVPESPDWIDIFVKPDYGRAVHANDPSSIAESLLWFYENPELSAKMGDRGRKRILSEWNYERQFELLYEVIENF